MQALAWLSVVNAGERRPLYGQRVLVLGGGDTAMDCARAALRLGASVTVAYRGPVERLRASPTEVALAREEGAAFLFEHRPLRCIGAQRLHKIAFETPRGTQTIDCDQVIVAFGQQPAPPAWLTAFDIATETDGRIQADPRGRTAHPKVWAGGDNTHGPDLAVTAMAAGRRAAESMLASFHPLQRIRSRQ